MYTKPNNVQYTHHFYIPFFPQSCPACPTDRAACVFKRGGEGGGGGPFGNVLMRGRGDYISPISGSSLGYTLFPYILHLSVLVPASLDDSSSSKTEKELVSYCFSIRPVLHVSSSSSSSSYFSPVCRSIRQCVWFSFQLYLYFCYLTIHLLTYLTIYLLKLLTVVVGHLLRHPHHTHTHLSKKKKKHERRTQHIDDGHLSTNNNTFIIVEVVGVVIKSRIKIQDWM